MLFGLFHIGHSVAVDTSDALDTSSPLPIFTESNTPRQNFNLTETEKQWLSQHEVIRFTGDPNWLPYEAFDDQGDYIGIVADYLDIIEDKLGIKLEIIQTKSWAESLDKIESGEIDVLSETNNSDLSSKLIFTQAYITSPVVIVMREDEDYVENIDQIKQRQIALIKNYGYVPEILNNYPEINFYNVDSIQNGLTAVSIGEVDALFATLAQASYHISELGMNNIRIVGKTDVSTSLAFGIKQDFAPLVPLFDRAISSMSVSEKQEISDRWGKQRYSIKTDYRLITNIAVVFLLILGIIIYWNRKLGKEIVYRKEIEQQTKALIDHIPLQVIVTALNGNILSANPKALADYQIEKDDIYQHKIHDFFTDINDVELIKNEMRTKGYIDQKITSFNNPDGTSHAMMVSVIPIMYDKQKALLSIAVDMTERLKMEQELKKSIENAERANAAKSQFLANMSHEIRTPMNAIIGYTELLNDEIKEPKLSSFAKTIQTAGNNLLVLINDILDLSKIESGKFNIELSPCNPHELFAEIGNIFMIKMHESNIDFILEIDEEIPQSLLLDYTRLRQVLFNLVGNSVKFTREGFIKISARIDGDNSTPEAIDLIIDIEDSGIGISSENQQIIFEKFEQSTGQDVQQYGGTGLGLSISKRFVDMMGGDLSVQSSKDQGSIFTIRLENIHISTVAAAEQRELPQLKEVDYRFSPANILIVDDIQDNRALLNEYFAGTDIIITQAENGLEAVNLSNNQTFDLILMDIRMPVMNGYQAAEKIKQGSNVPIIALTASVMEDQFKQLKKASFDASLRKPVLKKNLFKTLRRFIAFEKISISDSQLKTIEINDKEREVLPLLLPELKKLSHKFEGMDRVNNIDTIGRFSNAIGLTIEQYPVKLVGDYQKRLHLAVESFDVAEIKYHLARFESLIIELENSNGNKGAD